MYNALIINSIHIYIYMYTHTYIRTYIHICIYIYIYIHISSTETGQAWMQRSLAAPRAICPTLAGGHLCVFIYIYIYIYILYILYVHMSFLFVLRLVWFIRKFRIGDAPSRGIPRRGSRTRDLVLRQGSSDNGPPATRQKRIRSTKQLRSTAARRVDITLRRHGGSVVATGAPQENYEFVPSARDGLQMCPVAASERTTRPSSGALKRD